MTRCLLPTFLLFAAEQVVTAQEKVTFNDHARTVMENKCFSCHNPDKKRGDLDLTSFTGTMTGGGGGPIVIAGDAETSRLITTTTKKEEPFMPPEGSPLTAQEIEILTKWINGGLLENASSIAKKAPPKANIALAVTTTGKPEGPPPMPENVLLEPVVVTPRSSTITAMASSPWAPLVAVSGQKQVLLYNTGTQQLAGVLPYPEGFIRSLKFSQSGGLVVAGGGRGGKMGNAVVWDVKTGKRVTEVGNEFDQVMCADISPNQTMIAIGSPSKKVKCYNTANEEQYVISKHTEWVLALAFSPDGVLLASADRNGGVIVSEASNGAEFYVLDAHKQACTTLAWRADSNILATGGEDGKIMTFEMQNGKLVKSWDAHAKGCLSVSFTPDGKVVSSGRDGVIRVWDINGKKLFESKKQPDMVTRVAALHDSKTCVSGDWNGGTKIWRFEGFAEVGQLSSNPATIANRLQESEKRIANLTTQVAAAEAERKKAADAAAAKNNALAAHKKSAEDLKNQIQQLEAQNKQGAAEIEALKKTLADQNGKRQALAEQWKKHHETAASLKNLETQLGAQEGERATLKAPEQEPRIAELDKAIQDTKGKIDAAKNALAKPPGQPLEALDQEIKTNNEKLTAANGTQGNRNNQLAEAKKKQAPLPAAIAALEKEATQLNANLSTQQNKLAGLTQSLDFHKKQPGLLRAAQFNVGVLSEKEKLEKLDIEVKGLQGALTDTTAAKEAAVKRIEDSKKVITDSEAALPGLDANLAKLDQEQPAIEKTIEPTKAQEAQIVTQLNAEKAKVVAQQAEIKKLEDAKNGRVAAAKKAVEDINKQLGVLQKQLGEVNGKLAGPAKNATDKKAAFDKAGTDLNASKQQLTDAQQSLGKQQNDAKAKEAEIASTKPAVDAANAAINELKQSRDQAVAKVKSEKEALAAKEKELAVIPADKPDARPPVQQAVDQIKGRITEAEKAQNEAGAKVAAAEKTLADNAARHDALNKIRASIKNVEGNVQKLTAQVPQQEKNVQQAKGAFEAADKAAAPLRGQQANLNKQIEDHKKQLAAKQAEPATADKEFAAAAQPFRNEMTRLQGVIAPIEAQLVPVREKLAAEQKVIDAARATLAKAKGDVDGTRKRLADAKKTIETSTKEIADCDNALTEIQAELAKQEPQLQPLIDKVKQMSEQYAAMLPK